VTGLGWCIDVRATGGYVVGPGSHTPDGSYRPAGTAPIRALPTFLENRLRTASTRPSASPPAPAEAASAPIGRAAAGTRVARWWAAAVTGELANIAAAIAGDQSGAGRNATVNRAAYKLGRRLAAAGADGDADVQALTDRLVAAAVATGLSPREAATAVASGLAAGRARPRPLLDPTRRPGPPDESRRRVCLARPRPT
jgi:hypothetical protein